MMGTDLMWSREPHISPKYDVAKLHSVVGSREQACLGPSTKMLGFNITAPEHRSVYVLTSK
ncbi:hypothetical protein COCC4DRAFT_30661, partial [Bipolaris maydis ATCC 48331]